MTDRQTWFATLKAFLVCYVLTLLSGCATIFNGEHQEITITSNPPGALVSIGGDQLPKRTPSTVTLTRKTSHTAIVEKEGYETALLPIQHHFSRWNLIDGLWFYYAFIPALYDLRTGGFYTFDDEVHVTLTPTDPIAPVSVVPILMPKRISYLPTRVAVVPLSDVSGHLLSSWVDLTLALLRQRHPDIAVIERDALRSVTEELVAQHSG